MLGRNQLDNSPVFKGLKHFAITIMSGCVENHYFYCLEYDENGKCKDWAEMDTDPQVDNETPDNIKDADSEKVESEINNDFESEDFDDVLDESPELDEEKDDAIPDNDTDIPEDVCINLKNAGFLRKCYEAQDGEKIFVSDKNEPGRCRAAVESTVFPNRFFYGIELPFYTEDNSSSLDYNVVTEKVIIDTKEFEESSC